MTRDTAYADPVAEPDGKLFQKQRVDLGLPPETVIDCMEAASGTLIFAVNRKTLIRMQADQPGTSEDCDLSKISKSLKVKRVVHIFLDPSGSHLLVNFVNESEEFETMFLNVNSGFSRPSVMSKFKSFEITSVAWNSVRTHEESPLRVVLLGTSQGLLFEADLERNPEKTVPKQVHRIDSKKPEPIMGIVMERLPSRDPDGRNYFVILTTPCHSFQYSGAADMGDPSCLFQGFFDRKNVAAYHEMPSDLGGSLVVWPQATLPHSLAWLTAAGALCAGISFTRGKGARERLIRFESKAVACALTEFHLVLLNADSFQVVCLLNDKVVMTENFMKSHGLMRGLAIDPIMDTVYAYSNKYVFKIESNNETRDVWQLFLDKGQFEEAAKYAQTPAQMDKVLGAQAETLYKDGRFADAAALFAKTQISLEEICLRLIQDKQHDALRQYLHKKLLALSHRDKMQATMLCTWLVEIFLNSISSLADDSKLEEQKQLRDEFHSFLQMERVKRSINIPTIYDLIASHGNVEDLVFFAQLVEDAERVVQHFLQNGQYEKAIECLRQQRDQQLFIKYAPVLMQHEPRLLVKACVDRRDLDPRELIPAFIRYHQAARVEMKSDESIRYLEWVIEKGNTDSAIHNYLLSLYTKMEEDGALMSYLQRQGEHPCYDLQYALRLCTQEGKKPACVHIYSTMHLFQEAVDLALTVDIDLACLHANKPEDDPELRKKLWLRIAKHVIERDKDEKRSNAMKVLKRCDLLKIEDMLPFFPDFVTIDSFQDDIVQSLEDYNRDIDGLKRKMESASESARAIREDIAELKNKFGVVSGADTCGICSFPLLTRAFYLFPCHHAFHADCLSKEVFPHLTVAQQRKAQRLQAQIRDVSDSAPVATITQLRSDLDDIFTEDCITCGDIIIKTIDEPFIPAADMEAFMRTWHAHGYAAPVL